jgi:hypothetical protein
MSDDPFDAVPDMDLSEVYSAASPMEADRILMVLADEGIEGMRRDTSVSQFPSDANAGALVLVPVESRDKARELIQQAIDDEVIPADGTFLRGEDEG